MISLTMQVSAMWSVVTTTLIPFTSNGDDSIRVKKNPEREKPRQIMEAEVGRYEGY